MAEANPEPTNIATKFTKWSLDAWENTLTGLGLLSKDKRLHSIAKYNRLVKREIEDTYACDDMLSKIVDIPAEDMVREGFEVLGKEGDKALDEGIQAYLDDRNGHEAVATGLNWARLYGGSGVVMAINDGKESEEPVDEGSIAGIDFFNPLDRFELEPLEIQTDPEKERFGLPEIYRLQPTFSSGKSATVNIHWTRILRFDGIKLPRQLYVENNYWHAPVMQKTLNAIRNFQTSHDSVAAIMQDFAQAVFKINGLTDMIAGGNSDLLQKRLAMIDSMRSVLKAVVIEEGEEFERKMTSLAGVKDVLMMVNQRLVQASDGIPHTILLGESPSGLGATGESEITDYYDSIARKQETKLKPELERLIRYIFLAGDGPTKGTEPPDWRIRFRPLWQMDEKEQVELRAKQAEADEKYILNGVLTPDEVRESRFGGTEYSIETTLQNVSTEERTLNLTQTTPNPSEAADLEIEDALLATRGNLIGGDHTHRDIDNRFIGASVKGSKPGHHWHFGHNGEMFSEAVDGPGHTHKSLATGFETDGPTPLEERPDLVEDGKVEGNKYEDVIEEIKGEFVVKSKSGKTLGKFKTKEEAVKRLRQIEFFKRQ